jgi:hypothetical protein
MVFPSRKGRKYFISLPLYISYILVDPDPYILFAAKSIRFVKTGALGPFLLTAAVCRVGGRKQ